MKSDILSTAPTNAPALADVEDAFRRISPHLRQTPVISREELDRLTGARIFCKCENLQRTGSFKFRGALNAIFSLSDEQVARGVVTHSSGNHAAAVALAARERSVPAYIAVGHDTSPAKIAMIESYGGRLTYCDPGLGARELTARRLLAETGGAMVHPFDDVRVIAGQGTATLELLREIPDLDIIIAPVSGGGLLSGTAITARQLNPAIQVYGCEPELADDAARSFLHGRLEGNPATPATIADGLRGSLSERTYAILRSHVAGIVTVTEQQIVEAMRFFWVTFKLVIEPSSAVPIAALLERKIPDASTRRVGVIVSGGNVCLDTLPWARAQTS